MAEELASWVVDSGQRAGDLDTLQAITLFAGESATMRLARDDVRVEWFPPGSFVVEQGEPADALYLVLNGTADALLEQPDGQVTHIGRMEAGDFFGERDLMAGTRASHVLAHESLTCLVLRRTPMTRYAGRGAGAARRGAAHRHGRGPGDVRSGRHRLPSAQTRGTGAAPHPVPGRPLDAPATIIENDARHRVFLTRRPQPQRRWL